MLKQPACGYPTVIEGRGAFCPSRHWRQLGKNCSSLHLGNLGSFAPWKMHLYFVLLSLPPYFRMLFWVAKLEKEVGSPFSIGPQLKPPWKLTARFWLLHVSAWVMHTAEATLCCLLYLCFLILFCLLIVLPKGETSGNCLLCIWTV